MKADDMDVRKKRAGKQKPRDSHQDCILISQCGYHLLKDAESKPKTKLHADFYSNAFVSCSSTCISLSVDSVQNIWTVLWMTLAKDNQLRGLKNG